MGKPVKAKPACPIVREEKEDIFQAILLADNFGSSIFGPRWADNRYPNRNTFGDDDDDDEDEDEIEVKKNENGQEDFQHIEQKFSQESLLPFANRKLLDYSLEALTVSGVQEIFIYCSSGVDGGNAIKEHINKSRWNDLNVKINVISAEDCESLGDALRDLDAKGIIRNDFILMAPGVITNIPLKPLLEEHRKIMKVDKGAVMTLVRRKVPVGHRSRSLKENQAVVVDYTSGKILAYAQKMQDKRLKIPMENLKREMEVILDTVDSGITVCSSSVLPLFTDNFDFTNIPDFIKNILINEEVMGHTIYLHQVKKGYAARVVDFDTFLGVGLDIIQRWSYPLVPDMPFGSNPGDRVHQMGLNFVYKMNTVKASRDAMIGPAVVIGCQTVVGKHASIQTSSIGKKCSIGENSVITCSQIGDNVIIEDGCHIDKCVILDDSIITCGQTLKPNHLIVGKQTFPIQTPSQGFESDSDDDDEHGYASEGDGADEPVGHQERDFKRFCGEVMESLHRGYTDNVALENLFVEIQGSRTANFMYFDDATVAVIKGILGLAPKLYSDFLLLGLVPQWNKVKDVVVKYKDLLKLYVKNAAAQENLLKTIEEFANDYEYFRPMTMQLLHYYYNEDILAQEVILKWYKKESLYEAGAEIRKLVQKFIEWLETASEDESEESD